MLFEKLFFLGRSPAFAFSTLKEEKQARMSMVDGHPYKVEVGGSNPSVPTRRVGRADVSRSHLKIQKFTLRSRSSVG